MTYYFRGDFDLLPVRSHFLYGPVPSHPTYGDFALAVSCVEGNPEEVAAHWRVEAIRERRLRPGATFDDTTLRSINAKTAQRLYRAERDALCGRTER